MAKTVVSRKPSAKRGKPASRAPKSASASAKATSAVKTKKPASKPVSSAKAAPKVAPKVAKTRPAAPRARAASNKPTKPGKSPGNPKTVTRLVETKPAGPRIGDARPEPRGSKLTTRKLNGASLPPAEAPRLPQAPVTTDGKPKRNRAGLAQRELLMFRDLLLAKRRELLGDMSSMEKEALRSNGSNLSNLPVHMADMGTDNYEQEFTLGLVEKDRALLREINTALAKIQDGSYGICEGTGQPIAKARLEVQPWAKYSIEYARKLEQRLIRRPI